MIAGDLLGERARLTPEKIALVEARSGRRFTYAELDRRAAEVRELYVDTLASWPRGRTPKAERSLRRASRASG